MANLSPSGKPIDDRSWKIKLRRMEHDIRAMEQSIDKFEIDILEAEANVDRLHESIAATHDNVVTKRAELEVLKGVEESD